MKQFGIFLLVFGAGSFVLNMMNYEFTLMMWINTWGPTVGVVIRVAMIGLGILLLVLGSRGATEGAQPAGTQPPKPPGQA